MTALIFTVLGKAQPQGSGRAFTYTRKAEKGGGIGARIDSDNPNLKSWRHEVAVTAHLAMRRAGFAMLVTGPVRVCADVYLPCPKSRKPHHPHLTKPDIDKLARGLCDALTGIVWTDDSQVTQLKVTKAYASAGTSPCMVVSVSAIEAPLFAAQKERAL